MTVADVVLYLVLFIYLPAFLAIEGLSFIGLFFPNLLKKGLLNDFALVAILSLTDKTSWYYARSVLAILICTAGAIFLPDFLVVSLIVGIGSILDLLLVVFTNQESTTVRILQIYKRSAYAAARNEQDPGYLHKLHYAEAALRSAQPDKR